MRLDPAEPEDDKPPTPVTPALLSDDDDLREALRHECSRAADPDPCDCIAEKLLFLRAHLSDGMYAIVVEVVEAITQHHEEVLFRIVRDLLWRWAESDSANGVGPS